MGIKAVCRNCKREADSESFKLHYKYKMMVCPDCFSGRTEQKKQEVKKKEEVRPAGWDQEDDYLEKMAKMKGKDETVSRFTKIPGSEQVMYCCLNCKYSFRYHPLKKIPHNCPYCDIEIPKLKTFNLL